MRKRPEIQMPIQDVYKRQPLIVKNMRLIVKRILLMLLLLSVGNVLTGGFQLSAQEHSKRFSVKVDNITLKEAIEVIKKQGNYSFRCV